MTTTKTKTTTEKTEKGEDTRQRPTFQRATSKRMGMVLRYLTKGFQDCCPGRNNRNARQRHDQERKD